MSDLDGKVALITGAASGIGRASALAFAREGAAVMCADLNEPDAKETAETIRSGGGSAAALALDVTDETGVREALQATVEQLGGFDVLFNNAGVGNATWERTLQVNLTGVYYGLVHGAALLAERGGGAVISTASIAGLVGLVSAAPREMPVDGATGGGFLAYIASKHGVVGMTKQFALRYAREGVRVNAVAPGYIETPMTEMLRDDGPAQAGVEKLHPMGRLGQPEEIAEAALFLASERASFVTGVTLPVDGGYTAR